MMTLLDCCGERMRLAVDRDEAYCVTCRRVETGEQLHARLDASRASLNCCGDPNCDIKQSGELPVRYLDGDTITTLDPSDVLWRDVVLAPGSGIPTSMQCNGFQVRTHDFVMPDSCQGCGASSADRLDSTMRCTACRAKIGLAPLKRAEFKPLASSATPVSFLFERDGDLYAKTSAGDIKITAGHALANLTGASYDYGRPGSFEAAYDQLRFDLANGVVRVPNEPSGLEAWLPEPTDSAQAVNYTMAALDKHAHDTYRSTTLSQPYPESMPHLRSAVCPSCSAPMAAGFAVADGVVWCWKCVDAKAKRDAYDRMKAGPTSPAAAAGRIVIDPSNPPTVAQVLAQMLPKTFNPLDVEYDKVSLRTLLADDHSNRNEWAPVSMTPAQRAAVSAHWSADLRAKVAASKERERSQVVVDLEDE